MILHNWNLFPQAYIMTWHYSFSTRVAHPCNFLLCTHGALSGIFPCMNPEEMSKTLWLVLLPKFRRKFSFDKHHLLFSCKSIVHLLLQRQVCETCPKKSSWNIDANMIIYQISVIEEPTLAKLKQRLDPRGECWRAATISLLLVHGRTAWGACHSPDPHWNNKPMIFFHLRQNQQVNRLHIYLSSFPPNLVPWSQEIWHQFYIRSLGSIPRPDGTSEAIEALRTT